MKAHHSAKLPLDYKKNNFSDVNDQFRLALLVENQQPLENMKIWLIEVKNKTNLIKNKTSTHLY